MRPHALFDTRDRASLLGPMFVEIPEPEAVGARALYGLWRSAPRHEGLPDRDAFSFEALRRIGVLGHEFVIEPLDGGRDWRYRLVGTRITWMFGRDPTNIPFTRHFVPFEAQQCIAFSNQVVRTRQPVFLRAEFISGDHSPGMLETMSLPVWSRGRGEIWLIGASFPITEATSA